MPPRKREPETPEDFLPLHRDTFHILVALADQDRHGYSIMLDIAARTHDHIRLSPSTLYSSIKRLLAAALGPARRATRIDPLTALRAE